jgi:NADPH:quinone reductase
MTLAVQFDHYGGLEVLEVRDIEVPPPPAGEVTVEVRAAGINPGEIAIRQGLLEDRFPATFPSGEGSDLAGVVVAVGEGVQAFAAGDAAIGWTDRRGSHAERLNVPVDHLILKPSALSWEAAGSLYVVGVTAYAAVRAVGAGSGDTVVVSAAAGGVGSVAVQLLKVRGSTVIGIASAAHHAWLESVGVTPVAYGDGLADRIRALAPSGVDALIDTFGAEYVHLAVELGVAPERTDTVIAFAAAAETGAKTEASSDASTTDVLGEVADLVASGRITIPIAASYPLEEVQAAYTELAKRHTRGKVVLIP